MSHVVRAALLVAFAALACTPDPLAGDRVTPTHEGEGEPNEGEGEPAVTCVPAEPGVANDPTVALTTHGPLRGTQVAALEHDGLTRVFRGVRFAAPPTGDNRFRAPQPATCAPDVTDAIEFGSGCPQLGADLSAVVGDEDCLFLNVWQPLPRADLPDEGALPVLFFIHGGANIVGASNQEIPLVGNLYDGQALAENNRAIVVTTNYRLGALGFFAHDALVEEAGTAGNYGLLDLVAALEWTRDNIAAFGGDPARVMIFGESAGAANTCALIATPLAAGLFSAALMESGSCDVGPISRQLDNGARVATEACVDANTPEAVRACLRALPAAQVTRDLGPPLDTVHTWDLTYSLSVDGVVLPDAPTKMMERGEHNHVPFVVGSNSDEMSLFFPPGAINTCLDYYAALAVLAPDVADAIGDEFGCFDDILPHDTFIHATTDLVFTCPARRAARAMRAGQDEPVSRYHFRDRNNYGPGLAMGAFHASELFYVFDKLDDITGYIPTDGERELSKLLGRLWTNVARSGTPNDGELLPPWVPYDDRDPYFIFDERPGVGLDLGVDKLLDHDECDFFDTLVRE